jgi:hypothetical protein
VRKLESTPPTRARQVLRLRLLGSGPFCVTIGGRSVHVRRRQAEILALLALRPEGLTTDQLRSDLYGEDGSNSSVRGEVSRLRKLLGAAISTDPYRLEGPVECDAEVVRALLRRGALREAAERYAGPLLPFSDAPGIVCERDGLETWLRHAVMTGDDREALWAWVQSPSGRDDPAALKLVLSGMEFRDPRRSQVAAQLAGARAAR